MSQRTNWLVPKRVAGTELIDLPGVTERDLAGNLDDLARINRWFGGAWLTLRALERFADATAPDCTLTLLDVATGAADIPRAISGWAARRRQPVHILATDISPQIVQIANNQNKEQRVTNNIMFAAADGCCLPLADKSVDVALCSFALHHLDPPQAVAMLREMGRVARHGVVVNDLLRWWPAYAATVLISRVVSRNPMTRHDGPLSVLRAYTRVEMHALAAQAGLRVLAHDGVLGYRVALTLAR